MNEHMQPHRQATRRMVRSRNDWTAEAAKQNWEEIQQHVPEVLRGKQLDITGSALQEVFLCDAGCGHYTPLVKCR